MPSTTKYQPSYELIYEWVSADLKNETNAMCTWCKSIISVASMGESALKSHIFGKKHKSEALTRKKVVPLQNFMRKKGQPEKPTETVDCSNNNHETLSKGNYSFLINCILVLDHIIY